MTDTKKLINARLSVLIGLDLSGINHAADMLTLQFGPVRETTTRRGTIKRVGTWALHVQCNWQIEQTGAAIARRDNLYGSDEAAQLAIERLEESLVRSRATTVEGIAGSEYGAVCISMSGGLCLVITPDGGLEDEDWRFFAPGVDASHLVIEGGKVDPDSLS
jgi:hypothetical protein